MKKIINLKSVSMDLNPMIPPVNKRPKCTHPGCKQPRAIPNTNKDGSPNYRKVCQSHHLSNIAKKHGVKTAQHLTAKRKGLTIAQYSKKILVAAAKKAGYSNITDYVNSRHPYLKYRKDYCENIDKRLGFKCTTNLVWKGMLDVDHKNGDPTDNRPRNLQTLCKCCHAYKTHKNKDARTPGRKALKMSK